MRSNTALSSAEEAEQQRARACQLTRAREGKACELFGMSARSLHHYSDSTART